MLSRLLLAYLRVRARRTLSDEPLDFWRELGKVKTALVALPSGSEDRKALSRALARLEELFGTNQIRFLAQPGQEVPAGMERASIWEVDPKELRFKAFPTHRLWQKVHGHRADVFIDLHEEFDLLSAALAVASGAPLRICFAHQWRDPFYNLQVRTSGVAPARRYNKLIALLESCRATRAEAPDEGAVRTRH